MDIHAREGHALRRLPLPAGRPRRTARSTASIPTRSRSAASTATAPSARGRTVTTSGPAAPSGGTNLLTGLTPWGERRFEWIGGELIQRSMLKAGLEWEVPQVVDIIDPLSKHYSEKARLAKTMRIDGKTWGDVPEKTDSLAHGNDKMACILVPHVVGDELLRLPPPAAGELEDRDSSTTTAARPATGPRTIPQVIRHDIFMLGRHSTVKNHAVDAGALVERGRHQHDQREPRAPVLPAADGVGGGLQLAGLQRPLRAHGSRPRDPPVRRLPRLEQRGQQRLDGAGAHARHELRQLRRPLRLGRRSRGRHRGGRRHRVGRAAGGDRQQPAPHGVSRQLPAPPRPRPRAAGGLRAPRRRPHEPAGRRAGAPAARRVPLHGQRPRRLPRLRRREHRQQGLLGAHHHRSGLAARPARATSRRHSRPASRCRPTSRSTSAASTIRRTKSSRCTRSIGMPT